MKVKKIAALAIGAAMVGATMGFASAQPTVPNIPKDFFVNADGTPNVKIVVGSTAAAMDVASAADIAVALGSMLYTTEQAEVQNGYVKVKAEYEPEDVQGSPWTIYKYNYDTIRNQTAWATSYDDLPGDYWWNGAGGYDATYGGWKSVFEVTPEIPDMDKIVFEVTPEIPDMDKIGDEQLIDWAITIKNIELKSKDPSDWDQSHPPKDADLVITQGNVTVFVDYKLYNYTYTETSTVRDAYPEWGVPSEDETVTKWVIGDADDVPANLVSSEVYSEGVGEGDTFTVFGQTFYVLSVGNDTFTAGLDKGEAWYQVGQPQAIEGTDWIVTVLDISIIDQRALVVVKNAVTGQESDQKILEEGQDVDIFEDGSVVLTLLDTFVGIDGHLIASIAARVDVVDWSSGKTITYDGKEWEMTINTANISNKWYITNITLTNKDTLEGNPVDIFGTYNLFYKFEMKKLNEKWLSDQGYSDTHADIDGDGTIEDKDFIVAYAYICLKEKEGKVVEKELKVGDDVLDTDYKVAGIYGDVVTLKPITSPITVMDYEVDMEDPGANLILIGGPVANSLTKYLVEQNISQVDWYNSPGDIEYIQDALGGYDVVIVAGATRDETKVAAEALMEYLAGL
ncbi:S-layer protein [Thermococcus radiotolerans]|uniref:S-layer protein n=1 Tax=Thermococcus radiotolerans TaxID=187880 RepID=A0A2Z2N058_9EURY|nr:S-layer protein [Thermococcus radiotolerans]ASJ14307.1 S-layer protein [Thermococcus radiotolerans]